MREAESANIGISGCSKLRTLSISGTGFHKIEISEMSSLEELELIAKIADAEISACGELAVLRLDSPALGFDINYSECKALKDIYFYDGSEAYIPAGTLAQIGGEGGITAHIRKFNMTLQNHLEQLEKSYLIIEEELEYGDVNCDGSVNMSDVVAIMRYNSDPDEYALSSRKKLNADVIGNDGVTNNDALAIQQYEAGLLVSLPVIIT